MKPVMSIKGRDLLKDSSDVIYQLSRCDKKFSYVKYSKYGPAYYSENVNQLIILQDDMNVNNLCQIIAENMTNLYLEKIRLLGEGEEQIWQKEYILKSGFAELILK